MPQGLGSLGAASGLSISPDTRTPLERERAEYDAAVKRQMDALAGALSIYIRQLREERESDTATLLAHSDDRHDAIVSRLAAIASLLTVVPTRNEILTALHAESDYLYTAVLARLKSYDTTETLTALIASVDSLERRQETLSTLIAGLDQSLQRVFIEVVKLREQRHQTVWTRLTRWWKGG